MIWIGDTRSAGRLLALLFCLIVVPRRGLPDQSTGEKATDMQITKPSDQVIVLRRSFAAPRQKVFDVLTSQGHVSRWFQPGRMSLVTYEADVRTGGTSPYVFERPGGARMEMCHAYKEVGAAPLRLHRDL